MSASRMVAPFFAAWAMALISAWIVRKQFSSVSPAGVRDAYTRQPTSVQCGRPAGAPLYPVARMFLSRTMTAPTLARVQVERSATCRVMVMKYWCQLGRSLISILRSRSWAPRSRHDADRLRDEGEDKDGEGCPSREHAPRAERPRIVLARRMTQRHHERRDRGPEEPARPASKTEPEERAEEERGQQARPAAEHGVEHVAAVELTRRKQVQRRDEETHPAGEGDGVQHHGVRVRTEDEPRQQRGQQRVAQLDGVAARRRGEHRRQPEADGGRGHRDHEARPRAGGADVEQRLSIGEARADADERAEGADRGQPRYEVRQRRGHAVPPAHEIVAGLVHEQDRDQRRREGDPVDELPRVGDRVEAAGKRRRHGRGERRRGEQEGVDQREAAGPGDGHRPHGHLGLAHELRDVALSGAPTVTGSPTRAPRTALAEQSRTAISRSPQLFTTATAWPRGAAPYETAMPRNRAPAMLMERWERGKAASASSVMFVVRFPKRST